MLLGIVSFEFLWLGLFILRQFKLIGLVLGLFMGAIFSQYASWRWVFWFIAMMTLPIIVVGLTLIPPQRVSVSRTKWAKLKSLDLVGVSLLTGGYNMIFYLHSTENLAR